MAIPTLSLVAGTNPVEGGPYGAFNITLDSPAPAGGLSVNFDTFGGTATFGADYTLVPGKNVSHITGRHSRLPPGRPRPH